jgi:hypothetical protein
MPVRLIRRRADARWLTNSRLAIVRESWVLISLGRSERVLSPLKFRTEPLGLNAR